jgi:hypothetical protein
MTKIWDNLPKTVKVFFYLAVSTIFAEILIELRGLEQTLLVRILAQIINLGIVALQEGVPAVKSRFFK